MNILNDRIFSNIPDLVKARSHKYIKRTGSPGNYEYFYKEETGVKGKIENITSDQYNKIEAKAWKEYEGTLKGAKNEKEADKLYQRYTLIEEEAHKRLYVDKKEAGRKLDENKKELKEKTLKLVIKDRELEEIVIDTLSGDKRKMVVSVLESIRIFVPKDLNKKRQQLSVRDISEFLKQVPKEYRGLVKEIRISDDYFREGTKIFKNTTAGYGVVDNFIEIYRNDRFSRSQVKRVLSGAIRHEFGHALENTLKSTDFLKDWKVAIEKDGSPPITDYAKKDIHEDVAETLMYYWSSEPYNQYILATSFPNRLNILNMYHVRSGG